MRRIVFSMILAMIPMVVAFGVLAQGTVSDDTQPDHCWSNSDCLATEYCLFNDCTAETGKCTDRPTLCSSQWKPVCGCDGITYTNACIAALNGMSVDYVGECEPEHCFTNADCAPEEYCYFYVCPVETGVCLDRPTYCDDYYDPICSCLHNDYDNECLAAMAGESVDYYDVCK